jgi:hypothetical protein
MPSSSGSYTLLARVVPVASVGVPPAFLVGAGIISSARLGLAAGAVMLVASALAGQLGRDRGKRLERVLWKSWGGAPTLRRLRYDGAENSHTVTRLHQQLETLFGEALPSQAEEERDSAAADARYWEVTKRLIARTRDHDRFPLVFAENINYGMRRNLLGLKPIGIWIASLTGLIALVLLFVASGALRQRAARYGPGLAVAMLSLFLWILVVNPGWVRVPAEEYASRLMETVELLVAEP